MLIACQIRRKAKDKTINLLPFAFCLLTLPLPFPLFREHTTD